MLQEHLAEKANKLTITPRESLPPGSCEMWPFWACLSRLRTAIGLCKATLAKWDHKKDGDISCLYREEQTMAHLGEEQTMDHLREEQTMAHLRVEQTIAHLNSCPLLTKQCAKVEFAVLSPNAGLCLEHWCGCV